jgi:hypothetical protein
MTNTNCLEGITCPKCGNESRFHIEVTTMASVTDDGAETCGDMEWSATSFTECTACHRHGSLNEFRTLHIHPTRKE